ncbi:MAG TPA: hypothetical protein VH814_17875 [Steroidobacteraceae bacterium]|jgi:hypothetical protein
MAGAHNKSIANVTAAIVISLLTGCASPRYFVDGGLKDVDVSQIERLERPRPVQLLFAFKIRGLVDTRTSEALEAEVARVVTTSGLFAAVDEAPAAGGAILNVSVDFLPDTGSEVSRGVAAGLTLGLVGSTRKDPILCTLDYIAAPAQDKLTATAEHAIYVPLGIIDARPKGIILAKSRVDAWRIATGQSITAGLRDLSHSPAFRQQAQTP